MAIDALVKPLLSIELFQGLKPLQITEIARRADRIVYRPGDVIIAEDQPADAAVVIVSGEAHRVSGPGIDAAGGVVPEGSLIGEMAMLIETLPTSTVVARSPVRALRIARSEMHQQMEADPSLAEHFVDRISRRLGQLADELRSIDQVLAADSGGQAVH